MIPYQLKIQGIRDYAPRSIHLGDPDEHILITGPNGVGKSTLTFCLGAVLYSSKVEVEGLRSTNLKPNEPWNATIMLVFLNEGPTKVDGPKFIAFQLSIHQAVKNGPLQREFDVLNGQTEDELTLHARYTSGGAAGRTLTAYKEDLRIRYKVDPDLYYLIWYQQEVNQFAAMYPEERFRKFSDMFHISDIQKEWEASLAKIREVQVEIDHSKAILKSSELRVTTAKNELMKYLDNKKRILISGKTYFTLLHHLIHKYEATIEEAAKAHANHQVEKEKQQIAQQTIKREIAQLEQDKQSLTQQLAQLEAEHVQILGALRAQREEDHQKQKQQKQLEQILEQTTEKGKRLRYDEETTAKLLQTTMEQVEKLSSEEQQLSKQLHELREKEREMVEEKSTLQLKVTQLKDAIDQAEKNIAVYRSGTHIESEINKIEQQNTRDFEQIERLKSELKHVRDTMEQYKLNKVVSKRQQQGLANLKRQQIEAYPLRELIELIPSAPLKFEMQMDAIKYTIFYVGKHYKPVNDLYYVSLNSLVPTESVSKIPELGLQIRHDLNEQLGNYANKALWWVKQFFVSNPKIQQNLLYDERGVRGAQEASQYILSDVAIEKLLNEQQENENRIVNELQKLTADYKKNQHLQRELHGQLLTIQHAESTLLKQPEFTSFKQQLQEVHVTLSDIYDEQNEIEIQRERLRTALSDIRHDQKDYEEQMQIHEELGAFAEQQLQLQQVEAARRLLQQAIRQQMNRQETQETELNERRRKLSYYNEQLQASGSNLKIVESEITSLDLSIRKADDKIEADEAMKANYENARAELENILPIEAQQLDDNILFDQSITKLINESERVKAELYTARMEQINENAQFNYDQLKEEYDKKNAELAEAEQLFESYTMRANEQEDRLETTINMFLTKINALFQKYMDLFQFEGQVEKERIEEKNGRVKFLLYIKARKIGHQGVLEDVSMKARSGKVGKGVSGGEESLSSLLFALALLQNLSISPGYIVLDEFDSALDDERKNKVFSLYAEELQRKLIIVSPKGHDEAYYNCFSKVFIVEHDATIPRSTIRGIQNRK